MMLRFVVVGFAALTYHRLYIGLTSAHGKPAVPTRDGAQNPAAPPSASRAAHCTLLALRGRCEAPLAMAM